jgi:hypothetical protein
MTTITAWELIGDEGEFRIVGGRTVYSDVCSNGGTVRLCRLVAKDGRIHQINRYVDPDTQIEVIRNFTAEYAAEQEAELADLKAVYG